ncbi:MAG TPA: L-seryl-tRNA(Sec) selenium transferase [Thermoanaerobaculia bacterium]|nr:L-seryl-tRNA(Sec) selenium transferase [Thermoanaerobaculia bacterium]
MAKPSRSSRSGPSAPASDSSPLRRIPSVERLLSSAPFAPLVAEWGRGEVKHQLALELGELRSRPESIPEGMEAIAAMVGRRLERELAPSLRPVVNATGIVIHTNLGRSPVARELIARAGPVVAGYSNLELDLGDGRRGRRDEHVSRLAARLFGCEAAILVNNNAAAVLLALAALARGKEVVVSRGELVEIGGSFRVPEVIVQGGARLREVGTTNRTRAADYREAIGPSTGALLRVQRSNFEIVGFTESPAVEELVEVARGAGVPLIFDEGSGRVVDLGKYGLPEGATIRELIASGADLVTCSTDKLIGATQGGLILGKRDPIERCSAHPLMRALRAGKESYAVVGETLRAFLAEKHEEAIPIYRMLAAPLPALRERASRLAARVGGRELATRAALGGGTTPGQTIESAGVALAPAGEAESLRRALLALPRPVVARIDRDELVLDLRTVDPDDDEHLAETLAGLMR